MLNTNAVRTVGIVENRYFVGYLRILKVSTHPGNHATKAVHVAATWGRLALVPTEGHFGLSIMNFDKLSQLPHISLCSGAVTSCCSWAQLQTTQSAASRFQTSPMDVIPSGTRRKRFGFFNLLIHSFYLQAFVHVWDNHREDADWFIKADDDTYVIMENLKWDQLNGFYEVFLSETYWKTTTLKCRSTLVTDSTTGT